MKASNEMFVSDSMIVSTFKTADIRTESARTTAAPTSYMIAAKLDADYVDDYNDLNSSASQSFSKSFIDAVSSHKTFCFVTA